MATDIPLEDDANLAEIADLVARRQQRARLTRDGLVVGALISAEELEFLEAAEAEEALAVAEFDAALADPDNQGPPISAETLRAELASEDRAEYDTGNPDE